MKTLLTTMLIVAALVLVANGTNDLLSDATQGIIPLSIGLLLMIAGGISLRRPSSARQYW